MTMTAKHDDIRAGLARPLMQRDQRADINQAERIAAYLIRGNDARPLRRTYDPPGTVRLAIQGTVRVDDYRGLVVEIRGFVGGIEDRGLRCTDCPLSDLVIVSDGPAESAP